MKRVLCLSVDVISPEKPPTSLAFLAGVCERMGLDYELVSFNEELIMATDPFNAGRDQYNQVFLAVRQNEIRRFRHLTEPIMSRIVARIGAYQPDLIMLSVFTYMQYELAHELLVYLREHGVDSTVIAGGFGIGTFDEQGVSNGKKLLDQGLIQYYVLGEGDEILPRFLNGETELLGLNSAQYPNDSWTPQVDDLENAYIRPSYKKIDLNLYRNQEHKNNTILSLASSRGCVRNCSFCDVRSHWRKYRFRSGRSVAQEVLQLHLETGTVNFTIVDDLINGNLKTFYDFNLEMISIKQQHPSLADFSYSGMFIVRDQRSHSEEFFRVLAEAGCDTLMIGVETGSDRLRFEMDKRFTNQDLDHHLAMCNRYGIRNTIMMFVAYPTETEQDFQESLQLLERYQHYLINDTVVGIHFPGVFSLKSGTPVDQMREQLGIVSTPAPYDKIDKLDWYCTKNPELTVERRILRDLEFRRRAAELRYPIAYPRRYMEYLRLAYPEFQDAEYDQDNDNHG